METQPVNQLTDRELLSVIINRVRGRVGGMRLSNESLPDVDKDILELSKYLHQVADEVESIRTHQCEFDLDSEFNGSGDCCFCSNNGLI